MSAWYKFGSIKLSKSQLALLVGTPLAIGLGVYVYKKINSLAEKDPGSETKYSSASKKLLSSKKKTSIDATNEGKRKKKNYKEISLKDAMILKQEGNERFRAGKFDEAINFYDKAIDKCPKEKKIDMAIFYQNRAASYEMLKHWGKVIEDCTKALEQNPMFTKAYFRRARAYENIGDLPECLDDITTVLLLEMFTNSNTIKFSDRVFKISGKEDAKKHVMHPSPLLPSKNYVATYFHSFINDPVQTMILPASKTTKEKLHGFALAKKALDEQNYDEVIDACTEEIESSESEAQYKIEAILLRGTFYLLSGAFNEAKDDFDAVITSNHVNPVYKSYALIRRASYFIQNDMKNESLADFSEAQKLNPENPDLHHQRGQIYILLEDLCNAQLEFEEAIKLAPENATAFAQKCYVEYRLALLTQSESRLSSAMNNFQTAVTKFPDCVECYSLMAQVLSDQKQFRQADQFYEKAIKIAPDNASLLVQRGVLTLQWLGDIEKGKALIEKAIKIDDKCVFAYETLATMELQCSNHCKAVDLFEKAIKFSKTYNEISHLYALRNAAKAYINVKSKLGIDLSSISHLKPPFIYTQT